MPTNTEPAALDAATATAPTHGVTSGRPVTRMIDFDRLDPAKHIVVHEDYFRRLAELLACARQSLHPEKQELAPVIAMYEKHIRSEL